MNSSESIFKTLKYLDNLSNRSSQKELHEEKQPDINISGENSIKQNIKSSNTSEKKSKVLKKDTSAAAEPHLKQFVSMLSGEIANLKKLQQERLEAEEIERTKLEEIERTKLEEIERTKLEESKIASFEAEKEKIRLEEAHKLQEQSLIENKVVEQKTEVQQIKEYVDKTYLKPEANQSVLGFSQNKRQQRNLREQTDFVTFEDLKKHYTDFLTKINTQLASLGGGGEVLMRRLDDVDMTTIQDGDFISFDASTNKFVGGSISPGPEGTIEGGSF